MDKVVIVDYGMGNIQSVLKALRQINVEGCVSADHNIIADASKLILPGVGHFNNGMKRLHERNLLNILNRKVITEKTPILGICLGMQLFTKHSEEGNCDGLGWIDARTVKLSFTDGSLKVPHIGWNNLKILKDSVVLNGIQPEDAFYFVHSYHITCESERNILCSTNYGIDFVSVIQSDNIIGLQFHPEKSHKEGIRILQNFCNT